MSAPPYLWLLAAYPRAYREEHGAEILATLAEACPSGRRIPPLREVAALARGGMVARMRDTAAGPVPWWADGIHLGAFLIALELCAQNAGIVVEATIHLATHLGFDHTRWWWMPWGKMLPMLVVLALMRGWVWPALASTAVMAYETVYLDWTTFGRLPLNVTNLLYFSGALQTALLLAGLLVLAARRLRSRQTTPLRHRSWYWWLIVVMELLSDEGAKHGWLPNMFFWPGSSELWYTEAAITAALLLLTLWATATSGDLRWALAAVVFMTVDQFSVQRMWPSIHVPGHPMSHVTLTGAATLAALLLTMGLFARRARRAQRAR